jgi:AraC-like DNA-binding protein
MKPIIHLKSVNEINSFVHLKTRHPLVAVVDFSKADQYIEDGTRLSSDFYTIMFKNYCSNNLLYGRQLFDFQDGSLICIAPKQVLTMDSPTDKREDKKGWGLFFHPDLLRGTSLGSRMNDYTFFSYEMSEALHLSDKELNILNDCIHNIENELQENIDGHSQTLIVSNIELLLNYCSRFYGRQFITRKSSNDDVVVKMEKILTEYFEDALQTEKGLPTVKFLAERLHFSPSYLSDLLKKETGLSAQDHIHYRLIDAAKTILLNTSKTVGEIAFTLGFEYPQYFSKLFKQKTGLTPQEYRKSN